ncbi:uncharacterized protein PAC_09817 [Phialocephala subalpina]|uniref:Fibronectin type-III domain-containing protein n=1 Tax=Phialocephala subalpina TaxID=576137 RepID=A0A1L7X4J5_9HELO|nr:uncharacterized protein PAC_09817 [Phialocephala subalpina]
MWSSPWGVLLVLGFLRAIGAIPSSPSFPEYRNLAMNASFEVKKLMTRQDDDVFDTTDLSFITRLAAIGDSYLAGIGAGDRLGFHSENGGQSVRQIIDSSAFSNSLDALLQAAKAKLGSGYAKFWGEDLTLDCDSISWSTWIYKLYDFHQPEQKLASSHRRTMNELVDAVNAKLAAAVERAGASVKFVDYDGYVGYFNGRFCEAGVDETTRKSNTRQGLMFYELNSWDPEGASPWKRDTNGVQSGTFVGSLSQFAELTLLLDPDATLIDQDFIEFASEDISSAESVVFIESASSDSDVEVPNLLPDGYGRVFHPQILLHQLIANLVIYNMVNLNSQQNGFAAIPEKLEMDTCLYTPPTTTPSSDQGQQIALASYINPSGDPAAWLRILSYDSNKVSVLTANILNGPDYVVDNAWKSVIDKAASQGKKVIGYVRTGYLGVSQQQFTTRLGSHNLADWTSQIEQDIDKWFEIYGSSLGGIFFDEGWPECGPNNIYADVYAYINNYTKRKHPGAFTDQVASVAALALTRHAGLLEITDDNQPNPYDTLPNEAYMQAFMGAVASGKPRIVNPDGLGGSYVAGLPSDALVSSLDYSSVTLTWSSVGNALGYAVYKNGAQILELPASMTRATISMLEPGTSGLTFEVRTILASSSGSGSSRSISGSTKSLPATGTISNVGFTSDGNTATYTADVLVPYGFVRLFIGINQPDPGIGKGWPIQSPIQVDGTAYHELVNYLVEGNSFYSGLYKYTGTWYELSPDNAEWSWASIGTAPQTQSGYTYTWTVPLAGTNAVASEYIIQCQGYAPLNNVFKGTLRHYGTV